MKILFFNVKPFEKEYFQKNITDDFQAHYYSTSLGANFKVTDEIKDAEGISVFIDSDLSKKTLEKFPNLKFIFLRSVGYSHVDMLYCREREIAVFNAPHYGDFSIAEHVFALLLCVSRRICKASADLREQKVNDLEYQGIELKGKTMGIVGLGAIGKKVNEIAKGFSMNTICYDIASNKEMNCVSFDELCKKSDIISINCPLNSSTLHMFNENKFELMKNGVIIINTARGEIINSVALYGALLSGKVKFAALDVVECENVIYESKDDPIDINSIKNVCLKNFYITKKLLAMENVLVTPHIAYNTCEAERRILEITMENLSSSLKFTNSAKNLVLI